MSDPAVPPSSPQCHDFASPRSAAAPVANGDPAVSAAKPAGPQRSSTAPSIRPSFPARKSQRLTWSGTAVAGPRQSSARTRQQRRPSARKNYSQLSFTNDDFNTEAHVSPGDGRVHITVNALKEAPLATLLPSLQHERPSQDDGSRGGIVEQDDPGAVERVPPKLNIVIMVIGSRGDVQPFVAVAKELMEQGGHRVRLATHSTFRDFVEENGVEFFDIGGDPQQLMSFMVRNPGLIPSLDTIRSGDVQRHREQMAGMFEGLWRACIDPDDGRERRKLEGSSSNVSSSPSSIRRSSSSSSVGSGEDDDALLSRKGLDPFIADAIIANPPSFAHIHCAEKLGIPLQLVFTFPYSPTKTMPHPLAFIQNSNLASGATNEVSYTMVEMMIWQGLGDLINRFRGDTLGLEPVATLWAPGMISRLRVPYTYMWPGASRHLSHWRGIGGDGDDVPDNIYMLGNTPHDWLFPRVSAVVHHGGAGTVAIGLKNGKPTMVVPFFGDQPFWGAMISNAGAGPEPVPHKELTTEKLVTGIRTLHSEECQTAAHKISEQINAGDGNGAANAVRSFYKGLDELRKGHRGLEQSGLFGGEGGPRGPAEGKWGQGGPGLRCDMIHEYVAVWRIRRTRTRLSAVAAYYLILTGKLTLRDLRLVRHTKWNDYNGPGEPITGSVSAAFSSLASMAKGAIGVPYTWYKGAKRIDEEGRLLDIDTTGLKMTSHRRTILKPNPPQSHHHHLQTQSQPPRSSTDTNWTTTPTSSSSPETSPSAPAQRAPKHRNSIRHDLARGTTRSLSKLARAGARAPLDVSLAVAQGFHNAPRLYGDATVRRPPRVTGLHSGLRAAGKEFALGMYDGLAGVVSQPYYGARANGDAGDRVSGFAKGLARGLGGVVLKTNAAAAGLLAYSLKGVHKELRKERDRRWARLIVRARLVQGQRDYHRLREADELRVRDAAERRARIVEEEEEEGQSESEKIEQKREEEEEGESGLRSLERSCEQGWTQVLRERAQRRQDEKLANRVRNIRPHHLHHHGHKHHERDEVGRVLEHVEDRHNACEIKDRIETAKEERRIQKDEEGKA